MLKRQATAAFLLPRSLVFAAKSFRMRSSEAPPILHHFGANKSFRFRSYRYPARNSFIIRSYKNTGGWGPLPSPDLHASHLTSHRLSSSSCAKTQKCLAVSPFLATLTQTPGIGVSLLPSLLAARHSSLATPVVNSL